MKFHEKLQELRREYGFSQEVLAEKLDVSRQAVSKWESGQTYPETDKLIMLSEIFDVSLDQLIKGVAAEGSEKGFGGWSVDYSEFRRGGYEYKSEHTLWGLPVVHINFKRGQKAKGIVAVGWHAKGIVATGLYSIGVVSVGLLSVGLIGAGILSIGLGVSAGAISVGAISAGAVAVGVRAEGALEFPLLNSLILQLTNAGLR
ncbi:MAG: helix-turn-helix domain-containing protein [Oscillospiraceae bacterium]|nr:helix-turn-helix domain-containing protein [Oscillospiraceae bacterium]